MDVFQKPRSKGGKASVKSDAEKVEQAIKKAKRERMRKAVNNSFDRSIGSLRKQRAKKEASMNQSFVLKQAAALQRKNKEIIAVLTKTRQYTSQLEKVNFYYKEQQIASAVKVLSLKRKLKASHDDYCRLKERSDEMLSTLRKQFQSALEAIDAMKSDNENSEDVRSRPENQVQRQPIRVAYDPTSIRESEPSMVITKHTDDFEPVTESPCHKITDSKSLHSPPMSALDEVSQESSDSEEVIDGERRSSSLGGINLLNDASAKLDITDSSEPGSRVNGSDDESGECSESGNQENEEDMAENITDHDTVSMELTNTNVAEPEKDNVEQAMPNNDQSNEASRISRDTGDEQLRLTKSPEKDDDDITPEKKKTSPKTLGRQKPRKIRKPCANTLNESSYDFLSCSSDSFILDTEKRIKLTSTKSLSPEKSKHSGHHRLSQLAVRFNDENSPPRRTARRRAGGPVSYAEPSLNVKLRRGDRMTAGSLVESLTPKKKKRHSKPQLMDKQVTASEND